MGSDPALDALLAEVRGCRLCADHLPLGPHPVARIKATATLLIVGQAPGTKVHATGVPWNDRSGDQLRAWLGLDRETFYGSPAIAILPMGLCYPGRDGNGGDLPPRPECAPRWHGPLRGQMPRIVLTLLVGRYAQVFYLGKRNRKTVTETVRAWREIDPRFLPLPHPSWRSINWQRRNPWFAEEVLPALRERVAGILGGGEPLEATVTGPRALTAKRGAAGA